MAIYHLEAKVISRGAGRSAVAAAAYMSCSRITNNYDGVTHDYTRKHGLIWEKIFLPKQAPGEWADRGALWNAVEAAEKTKDSRLAREVIVALPIETTSDVWQEMLTDFIKHNFGNRGMCAHVCVHDTDGHNPHAHIMLTVRPLTDQGKWQAKTQKEYLCVKDGYTAIGLTAAEYKAYAKDGWEKQYLYKTERGKEWLPLSVADCFGYERVNKYPKCTMYGRQNPISADWNSEETLQKWRENWAKTVNRTLEELELSERIDHRSYRAKGIHRQPTVHVGVSAWKLTAKLVKSERMELNRLIGIDNKAVNDWAEAIETLTKIIFLALSKLVDAVATAWEDALVFQYCSVQYNRRHTFLENYEREANAHLPQMDVTEKQIKEKEAEVQSVKKKLALPFHLPGKKEELEAKLRSLNAEMEELRKRQAGLIAIFNADDIHTADDLRARMEENKPLMERLAAEWDKAEDNLLKAVKAYEKLKLDAKNYDQAEYKTALATVRPKHEQSARAKIKELFGKISESDFDRAKDAVSKAIGEWQSPKSVTEELGWEEEKPVRKPEQKMPGREKSKERYDSGR